MKILIIIFFFKFEASKITRGHDFTMAKSKVDWMLDSIRSPRKPSMHRIKYLLMVNMLVVLISSRAE